MISELTGMDVARQRLFCKGNAMNSLGPQYKLRLLIDLRKGVDLSLYYNKQLILHLLEIYIYIYLPLYSLYLF